MTAQHRLMGYVDTISASPGGEIAFHLSGPPGRAEFRGVRVHGVDTATNRAALEPLDHTWSTGHCEVRPQELRPGSYATATLDSLSSCDALEMSCWVQPTLPDGGRQVVLHLCSDLSADSPADSSADAGSVTIYTEGTQVHLEVTHGARTQTITTDLGSSSGDGLWSHVLGHVDGRRSLIRLSVRTVQAAGLDDTVTDAHSELRIALPNNYDEALIGAERTPLGAAAREARNSREERPGGVETTPVVSFFNGRLDNPRVWARETGASHEDLGAVAEWDFSIDIDTRRITDISGNGRHGQLVNRPGRGLIGHRWRGGDPLSHPQRPELWSAIHFSRDDLNDAGWTPTFTWRLPDNLESGVYAAEITLDDQSDVLPFFVRATTPTAPVLLMMPTNTYLAYANEHLGEGERGQAHEKSMRQPIQLSETDRYIHAHRELGLSIYDRHSDGTGVMYSSWRRPVLNFKPDYETWLNAARRHLAADLWIVGWLEDNDIAFDVATDEDVDRDGRALLDQYRVVITGTHPEYPTVKAYDAVAQYVRHGGRAMNLGGNGFYWVTTYDGDDTKTLEVRRGLGGQRNWTSHPAELLHSSTGHVGGIHLHTGRNGRELWGVTSAGVGWGPASGYQRTADSYAPDLADLFEGVTEHVIGDFGLVLGGAAGDELESADFTAGTPAHARVLASSSHGPQYQPFIESVMAIESGQSGPDNPNVRADIVLIEGRGSVFSVGSINWAGAMAHNAYVNNAARLSANVLHRFLNA